VIGSGVIGRIGWIGRIGSIGSTGAGPIGRIGRIGGRIGPRQRTRATSAALFASTSP
jgi:hypothetical protein